MDEIELKLPYQALERDQNQHLYAYPASAKTGVNVNDSTYENVGVHVSRLPEYVHELHQKENGFKIEFEVINFVKLVIIFPKVLA